MRSLLVASAMLVAAASANTIYIGDITLDTMYTVGYPCDLCYLDHSSSSAWTSTPTYTKFECNENSAAMNSANTDDTCSDGTSMSVTQEWTDLSSLVGEPTWVAYFGKYGCAGIIQETVYASSTGACADGILGYSYSVPACFQLNATLTTLGLYCENAADGAIGAGLTFGENYTETGTCPSSSSGYSVSGTTTPVCDLGTISKCVYDQSGVCGAIGLSSVAQSGSASSSNIAVVGGSTSGPVVMAALAVIAALVASL